MSVMTADDKPKAAWPAAIVMATLMFFTSWFYIWNVQIGQPPDEWAQISYVSDITSGNHLIPDYSNSTILNSGQQNYLTHPPLYYTTLGVVGRALNWDPKNDFQRYRVMSALMVAIGVYLWVLISVQLGFSPLQAAGLTGVTLAIPMFPYLAGSVNNDDLAYLGVAIFFYGFSLMPRSITRAAYIAALGLLVTMLTKATGTVFLLAFMVLWGTMSHRSVLSLSREKHVRVAASIVAIIASIYYLPTFLHFHTFFPAPGGIYLDQTAPSHPVRFTTYVVEFIRVMFERLPVDLAAKPLFPISENLFILFYAMLSIPLVAWLLFRPFSRSGHHRHITDAFILALIVTLAANLWVGWRGYLQTGLYAGLQPRYYNYVLPGLFLFAFYDGRETGCKRVLLILFSLLVAVFAVLIPPRAAVVLFNQQSAEEITQLVMPNSTGAQSATLPTVTLAGAGHLDRIDLNADTIRLSGWAVDIASNHPARALWVNIAGRLVGTAQATLERPDVVKATGKNSALRSGFVITVSNVPRGLSPCEITVQVEQDNGTLAQLPNSSCAQINAK